MVTQEARESSWTSLVKITRFAKHYSSLTQTCWTTRQSHKPIANCCVLYSDEVCHARLSVASLSLANTTQSLNHGWLTTDLRSMQPARRAFPSLMSSRKVRFAPRRQNYRSRSFAGNQRDRMHKLRVNRMLTSSWLTLLLHEVTLLLFWLGSARPCQRCWPQRACEGSLLSHINWMARSTTRLRCEMPTWLLRQAAWLRTISVKRLACR